MNFLLEFTLRPHLRCLLYDTIDRFGCQSQYLDTMEVAIDDHNRISCIAETTPGILTDNLPALQFSLNSQFSICGLLCARAGDGQACSRRSELPLQKPGSRSAHQPGSRSAPNSWSCLALHSFCWVTINFVLPSELNTHIFIERTFKRGSPVCNSQSVVSWRRINYRRGKRSSSAPS